MQASTSTIMLSILSGSLIDVLVSSLVSSSSADGKDISRLSSCVSASFWLVLFIYLFLRKVLAGVAKRFLNLYRRPRGTPAPENSRRRMWPIAQPKPQMFEQSSAAHGFEVSASADARQFAPSRASKSERSGCLNSCTSRTRATVFPVGRLPLLINRAACDQYDPALHSNSTPAIGAFGWGLSFPAIRGTAYQLFALGPRWF